jgi:hypothetical protein
MRHLCATKVGSAAYPPPGMLEPQIVLRRPDRTTHDAVLRATCLTPSTARDAKKHDFTAVISCFSPIRAS